MKIRIGDHLIPLEEFMDALDELIDMEVIEIHIDGVEEYHFHVNEEKRIIN